jgi:hypothetical protein
VVDVKEKLGSLAALGELSKLGVGTRLVVVLVALASLCVCAAAQEDTADYWYKESGELFVNGSSEESVRALDKALQIDPENATI